MEINRPSLANLQKVHECRKEEKDVAVGEVNFPTPSQVISLNFCTCLTKIPRDKNMFFVQIDTDANRPDRSSTLGNRRPTSYQPPLLQCAQESPWKHDRTPHELLPQIRLQKNNEMTVPQK